MANSRLCSIPECGKPHEARGYCKIHYKRFMRYGNEHYHRRFTAHGEPQDFIRDVVMQYEGNACILWPFARNHFGYGMVTIDGKLTIASRYICRLANGEPASNDLEAAHSCHRGDEGCVSKKHLAWKTRADNARDKIINGSITRGQGFPHAVLDEDKVRQIRSLRGKRSQRSLAEEFGVAESTIYNVQKGKKWAWV